MKSIYVFCWVSYKSSGFYGSKKQLDIIQRPEQSKNILSTADPDACNVNQ